MKKWLFILLMLLTPGLRVLAQSDDATEQETKIQSRMREYIQDRLNLSRNEAEKFTPVFVRYFREFALTHRMYKDDRLLFQQKVIELRIRYRTEFRQIMDEQRANKVFKYEDEFRQEVMRMLKENRRERLDRPMRRDKMLLQ
jgi:hypothetical protein